MSPYPHPRSEAPERLLPPVFRDLNTVACALVMRDGALRDANAGFRRLVPNETSAASCLDVRHLFVQPRFDEFAGRRANDADGSVYRGILNIGDINAPVRSLRGVIYSWGEDLLVVAEHDIADLERNVAALCELINELADTRREIARLERTLERRDVGAKGAIADREALLAILSGNPPAHR